MRIAGITTCRRVRTDKHPITGTDVLAKDPKMIELMALHPPPRIGHNPIFFSLIRAIISQQLSEAAAATIFKRLKNLVSIEPEPLLALDTEAIRSCGISGRKADYIKSISAATINGALDNLETLPDEEAIISLVTLKGVGRWTAEMILIFSLGREDVWPCDDAGLLRSAKKLYGTANLDEFIKLGERFKPFRTHAAWYLWASLDKG